MSEDSPAPLPNEAYQHILKILLMHLVSMHIRGKIQFREEIEAAYREIGTTFLEWDSHQVVFKEELTAIYESNRNFLGVVSFKSFMALIGFQNL